MRACHDRGFHLFKHAPEHLLKRIKRYPVLRQAVRPVSDNADAKSDLGARRGIHALGLGTHVRSSVIKVSRARTFAHRPSHPMLRALYRVHPWMTCLAP